MSTITVAYRTISLKPTFFVLIKLLSIHLFLTAIAWSSLGLPPRCSNLLHTLLRWPYSFSRLQILCLGLYHTYLLTWISSFRLIAPVARVMLPVAFQKTSQTRDALNSILDSSPVNVPWICFFFLATWRGLRDLSSPIRDWTQATTVKALSLLNTGPPGNSLDGTAFNSLMWKCQISIWGFGGKRNCCLFLRDTFPCFSLARWRINLHV